MFKRPILIREAGVEDIPFLQVMIWEAMLASPIFLARYGVEPVRQAEEQYWQRWGEHPDPAFVAFDADGQKLGAITMKPDDVGTTVHSWRIGIGVEAHMRGQGIGHDLIKQAITEAKAREADFVTLLVDPNNTTARMLYQKVGFVEVGEKDQLIKMQFEI